MGEAYIEKAPIGWWVMHDPEGVRATCDSFYDAWRPTKRGALRSVRRYYARLDRDQQRIGTRLTVPRSGRTPQEGRSDG